MNIHDTGHKQRNETFQEMLERAKAKVGAEMNIEGMKNANKVADLLDVIPTSVENPAKNEVLILTPDTKSLIIAYMFIGLAEATAALTNTPLEVIWAKCAERAVHNLHKDGLFD